VYKKVVGCLTGFLIFFIILSGPLFAGNEIEVGFDLSFLNQQGYKFDSGYGATLSINYARPPVIEVDFFQIEKQMSLLLLYGSLKMGENILGGADFFLEAGAGVYRDLITDIDYQGLLLGANFVNNFREDWTAFTSLRGIVSRRGLIPLYETGFVYHYSPEIDFRIFYRGFNLDSSAISLGLSYRFSTGD